MFQEMDDGEPQSMSQVLWLISLGLTSGELITILMVSLMNVRRMKRCRRFLQQYAGEENQTAMTRAMPKASKPFDDGG